MYKISKSSSVRVNSEVKQLRLVDKDLALKLRKVHNSIQNKVFDTLPSASDLVNKYTGQEQFNISDADILIAMLKFEEINLKITKAEFKDIVVDFETADAELMSKYLFNRLGTEIADSTNNMTLGLKFKLDLLDEFKANIVKAYPDTRREELTKWLANTLYHVKSETGKSSLELKDGKLRLYSEFFKCKGLNNKSAEDFMFLADLDSDSTKSLEVLILESAFKSYREQVALGKMPITCNKFNLRFMQLKQGLKAVDQSDLDMLTGN